MTDRKPPTDWLDGEPMDPMAIPAEPLPPHPGIPFAPADEGCGIIIVGPTGSGRSALVQACLYDSALAGKRCAYLGHEVTRDEFDARAAVLASARGDALDDELLAVLRSRVRYLDLASVVVQAWENPERWAKDVERNYEVISLDPASAAGGALDLDFDKSNTDWIKFYDRLVQPVTARGVIVLIPDNVGHAIEAKSRARGPSAKGDRADLTFACSPSANPEGLRITARKVRSVRAPHQTGDSWVFVKSTQRVERHGHDAAPVVTAFRPTNIMQKVSREVERHEGMSKSALRTAIGGNARNVDLAIELLIAEGFVEVREGERGAHHHQSIRPYREADDPATKSTQSAPSPHPVSDSVPPTKSDRVPPPVGGDDGTGLGGDGGRNGGTESLFADEAPRPQSAILGDGGVRS